MSNTNKAAKVLKNITTITRADIQNLLVGASQRYLVACDAVMASKAEADQAFASEIMEAGKHAGPVTVAEYEADFAPVLVKALSARPISGLSIAPIMVELKKLFLASAHGLEFRKDAEGKVITSRRELSKNAQLKLVAAKIVTPSTKGAKARPTDGAAPVAKVAVLKAFNRQTFEQMAAFCLGDVYAAKLATLVTDQDYNAGLKKYLDAILPTTK